VLGEENDEAAEAAAESGEGPDKGSTENPAASSKNEPSKDSDLGTGNETCDKSNEQHRVSNSVRKLKISQIKVSLPYENIQTYY
jgi:hypothetical protein